MGMKEFGEGHKGAGGAPLPETPAETPPTETPEIVSLNVGTAVNKSQPRTPRERPTEGQVRTTDDGYRQVYRKAGGWAVENEPHPDSEPRVHLKGFSRKISELTSKELEEAKGEARSRESTALEELQVKKGGEFVDLTTDGGSSSSGTTDAGEKKSNKVFDELKGRFVRIRTKPVPKDVDHLSWLSSRHPSPGVSASEGIPAYDRRPKEIESTLENHIKLIGDFLQKARSSQGPYIDEFGGKQIGFADDHPLADQAAAAALHHYTAQQQLKEARNIGGRNVSLAHSLIRSATISIHKASKILNTADFALAAGGWPDMSVSPTETEINRNHAIVELQHPREAKRYKGIKLHNVVLDTSDAGNTALFKALGQKMAVGGVPGVDRNLYQQVKRWWSRPTPLGSVTSENDIHPMGFKGDILANPKAATTPVGSNPFGATIMGGSSSDDAAPSAANATKPKPQPKPKPATPQAKPERKVYRTKDNDKGKPTTKRGSQAKAKRSQKVVDKAATDAATDQISALQAEVSGVSSVRGERQANRRRSRESNGIVFVKGPDGKPVRLTPQQNTPKRVRLKKRTAQDILSERGDE